MTTDTTTPRTVSLEEENKMLRSALMAMADQYLGSHHKTASGKPCYDHSFMSAGEEALETMVCLGMIEPDQDLY